MKKEYYIIGGLLIGGLILFLMNKKEKINVLGDIKEIATEIAPKIDLPTPEIK